MTSRVRSAVSTQYRVRIASRVCFAKNVFVKPRRSRIGAFAASAHHDVNSNELLVRRTRDRPAASSMC